MPDTNSIQPIKTAQAPVPAGPYYQATVLPGSLVFCSGQIGMNPHTGQLAGETDIAIQTEQAIDNLEAILNAADSSSTSILKITIYLTDMEDFAVVNQVYARRFGQPLPARTCVAISALPHPQARVEIEAIALQQQPSNQ